MDTWGYFPKKSRIATALHYRNPHGFWWGNLQEGEKGTQEQGVTGVCQLHAVVTLINGKAKLFWQSKALVAGFWNITEG